MPFLAFGRIRRVFPDPASEVRRDSAPRVRSVCATVSHAIADSAPPRIPTLPVEEEHSRVVDEESSGAEPIARIAHYAQISRNAQHDACSANFWPPCAHSKPTKALSYRRRFVTVPASARVPPRIRAGSPACPTRAIELTLACASRLLMPATRRRVVSTWTRPGKAFLSRTAV